LIRFRGAGELLRLRVRQQRRGRSSRRLRLERGGNGSFDAFEPDELDLLARALRNVVEVAAVARRGEEARCAWGEASAPVRTAAEKSFCVRE